MKTYWIAMWNVWGMSQSKLDIIKWEMARLKIDLLSINKLDWINNSYFQSEEFTIYYSEHDIRKINVMSFIISKKYAQEVESFSIVNDCIRTTGISSKPLKITILQVYILTTNTADLEIEGFLCQHWKISEGNAFWSYKWNHINDFSAKVCSQAETGITGSFGLRETNKASNYLAQFYH